MAKLMRIAALLAAAQMATPMAGAAAAQVGGDAAACAEGAPAIRTEIVGLKDRSGRLKLELYPATQADFLRDDRDLVAAGKTFRRIWATVPASGPVALCIRVPHPGTYALFFTHDRDGKNKFNIWSDGAGLPTNQRIGRAKPALAGALVTVGARTTAITIRAQYLHGFPPQLLAAEGLSAVRIVDVNEFYSPTGGGVRTYIDRKMGLLDELGHELIVLAPGRETRIEERPGGGRIHYLHSPPLPFDYNYGLFWDRGELAALLDHYDADVVECSSPWRAAWFVGDWQGRAVKSFFMHNDNLAAYAQRWFEGIATHAAIEHACAWYTRYMARFLDKYDCVVTNGPALEKRMQGRGLRIDAAMPLGIERAHFSPDLRDERLRRALLAQCGLGPEGLLLLGLGRHHKEKRWSVVIDAAERAGAEAPIGLILLGQGVETERIEKRIAGSPHLRMFRPVYDRERLSRIMASCDALIHGSESEPFGLVASEAMASGLPLIVPDTGGCAEVADPHSSELYTARGAESCAAAILRLARRDRAMLRRAAEVAARSVRSDRDHAVDLMAYYQGLVDAKTATPNGAALSQRL